jgi:lipopolysaccharide export system protein LptC
MLSRWSGWLILIILAFGTTWLEQSIKKVLSKPSVEISDNVPDYTMKNFQTKQMDEQGYLKNELTAETMIHYKNTNTKLNSPSMVFYEAKQPVWTVRSEQGEISPDGEQIWLLGEARLQRYNQSPPLEIISRDIWLQLEQQYAETAAPTTIISGLHKTQSVGMRVFMLTKQIELISQVRGHYEIP